MSSIAQQSAALAAANANKPSSLQTAISGGTSGAIAGAGLASLWEHQHLGALALVLVSDCLARCFKG